MKHEWCLTKNYQKKTMGGPKEGHIASQISLGGHRSLLNVLLSEWQIRSVARQVSAA